MVAAHIFVSLIPRPLESVLVPIWCFSVTTLVAASVCFLSFLVKLLREMRKKGKKISDERIDQGQTSCLSLWNEGLPRLDFKKLLFKVVFFHKTSLLNKWNNISSVHKHKNLHSSCKSNGYCCDSYGNPGLWCTSRWCCNIPGDCWEGHPEYTGHSCGS